MYNQYGNGSRQGADRLPYKQEVGGSNPLAPTTNQSLTPSVRDGDHLPNQASGSDSVSQSCLGGRCAKCRDRAIQKPGTHTTNSKAAVGLGAHWFPGECPAGNSPLICGGRHLSGCLGLRAGCASLHRCKWRQGSTAEKIPTGTREAGLKIRANSRTGINHRERDSNSPRHNRISKLLILQAAHQAQTTRQDQGTHERPTGRRA